MAVSGDRVAEPKETNPHMSFFLSRATIGSINRFGVVLLELITGRRVIDSTRPRREVNPVSWAKPLFSDRKQLPRLADPRLGKRYPMRGLYQALSVASMCIHENSANRPHISEVVTTLTFLGQSTDSTPPCSNFTEPTTPADSNSNNNGNCSASSSGGVSGAHREETESSDIAIFLGGGGSNKAEGDRERLAAEAKQWGQNWRQKMKGEGMSSGEG